MWDASLGLSRRSGQPHCGAQGSMDGAGADLWVNTFAQLMADKKPQDVWVLQPQESLEDGHVDSGCLQYQLKGLSRLQCSRCPWTWGSAHVRILFHLWWDGDSGQGLVRMHVWGQQCRLCPPGALGDCRVSPRHVQAFLGELVLYILQKCYGDGQGPGQCPEACLGDHCEACDLGVCFLQQAPDPARRPVVGSASTPKGRQPTCGSSTTSGGSMADAYQQQLPAPSSGPMVRCPQGHNPKPVTISLLVIEFGEAPFSGSSDFLSEGDCVMSIPFSLVDVPDGHGHVTSGVGSLPAAGGSRPPVIGQGSIYLSGSSLAMSKDKGIPVNVRAPIFHSHVPPGSITKTFELRGFQFGGQGSMVSPIGVAKGQGPISFSDGRVAPGSDLPPVSYIVGLMANGQGAITFPICLTNIIRGKDRFPNIAENTGRKDGGQSLTSEGDGASPAIYADGPTASQECSVTFPFIFTEDTGDKDSFAGIGEGKEKEDGQDPGTAGNGCPPERAADGPISISEGAITIPFSVFSIIKRKGPSYVANGPQSSGFVTYSYYKKRRLRSRFGKPSRGSRREEAFRPRRASPGWHAEGSEDFWICISMTICVFWLMCMYRLNLGFYPQQA